MALATCSANSFGFLWPQSWGTSGVLKIISDREFVSGNLPYPAGRNSDPIDQNFCYQSAITVVGSVGTFAAITLPQTDAADVQAVNGSGTPTYTGIIYSNGGKTKRQNSFQGYHLSESLGLTFSFSAWVTDNNAPTVINPRSSWVDTDTLNRTILAALYAPSSTTQLGLSESSTPPANTSRPVHIEDTDPRVAEFNAGMYTATLTTVPAPTIAPTVSTPTVTLGTFGTQPGNAAFTDAHRYEVAITYNGRTGESVIGTQAASFTATEGQGLAVAPNAPSTTLAASANIYIKDLDDGVGAAWHRAADASGAVENNNCGFGDNDSAVGGMVVKFDPAGAAPPGVSTATKPDGITALGETPTLAPTLTKLTSILSTIGPLFFSYYWLTENGWTALSPFSSGVTAPSGTVGAWMPLYIPEIPPVGAVAIRVYAGLAATQVAMHLQVEGEVNQVRFPIHSYNGSGAAYVTSATPTSTIPRILLAALAALTAGGGDVVSPTGIETTTIPLIFGSRVGGVFKAGVRLVGRGANDVTSSPFGLTKINYVGARSGVAAVVLAAGGLQIENIEFGDPNNKVKHGLSLAGFDSSAGYNYKVSDLTVRANAPGSVGIVCKTNQCGSGAHAGSDSLFDRITVFAESCGVDLSGNQNVWQQFRHVQCTITNSANRANSASVRIATTNNSFDGVEQAGSAHYKYYFTNEYLDDFGSAFAAAFITDSYDESAARRVFCYTSPLDINGSGPAFGVMYLNNQTGGQIYGLLFDNGTRGSVDLINHIGPNVYNFSNSATGNIEYGRSPGGASNPLPNWGSRASTAYTTPMRTLCNGAYGLRNASGNLSTWGTNAAGDIVLIPFSGANVRVPGLLASGVLGVGYATGAGGTVTQSTDKSTGVTLDKTTGTITMNNAALGAGAEVSFVVTNSTVAATDVPVVAIKSGGTLGAYLPLVSAVGAGSFTVTISNLTAGSLSEAIVISFVVFKGVAA